MIQIEFQDLEIIFVGVAQPQGMLWLVSQLMNVI